MNVFRHRLETKNKYKEYITSHVSEGLRGARNNGQSVPKGIPAEPGPYIGTLADMSEAALFFETTADSQRIDHRRRKPHHLFVDC